MSRAAGLVMLLALIAAACAADEPSVVIEPGGTIAVNVEPGVTLAVDIEPAPVVVVVEPGGTTAVDVIPKVASQCGPVRFPSTDPDWGTFDAFGGAIDALMPEGALLEYQALNSLEWFVAERDESSLLLFGVGEDASGPTYGYIRAVVSGGELQASGWGGCSMETSGEGFGVASFQLDPANPPDPTARELHIWASEHACANGQAPSGRQIVPVVVESADAVEITILVEPVTGIATCPGNPSFPLVVPLDSPLGDRVIRDAAEPPAQDRPWPIPLRDGQLEVVGTGDAPAPGTANVVGWGGLYGGALIFPADRWFERGTSVGGFFGGPLTITGFVTSCGPQGCAEECESEGNPLSNPGNDVGSGLSLCDTLPRLGEECSHLYTATEGHDTLVTVQFAGDTCTIEVSTSPIPPPEPGSVP